MLLFSTTAYSENTPANHAPGPVVQRGAKLWSLPIGGRLTLSRDGKTLLVASLADSNFYVVDVETGTIRRKLTPKFNWNSDAGTPFYQVDNDLKWIGLKASGYDGLWDIETDTLVTQLPKAMYDCLSKKLQRLVVRSALSNQPVLYDVTNNRAITEFSVSTSEYGIEEWFDDDRGLLYRSYDGSLEVYDAITGERLPGYGIRGSREGVVRRPATGNWIYYLSTYKEVYHGIPQNSYFVKAFKPDDHPTSDGVIFNWDSLKMESTTMFSGLWSLGTPGQTLTLSLYNCVWQFDANSLQYRIIFKAQLDTFPGDYDARDYKNFVITPSFDKYINCFASRNKEAAYLTCYALEPAATAVESETSSHTSWLTVGRESLTVAYGSAVDVVTLTASDGRVVSTLTGPWDHAFSIPIGNLASGVYLCSIGTSSGEYSTSFTITR